MPIIPKPSGGSVSPSDATPTTDSGAGEPGTSALYSRGDHQHPAAGGAGTMEALKISNGQVNAANTTASIDLYSSGSRGIGNLPANTSQDGDQWPIGVRMDITSAALGFIGAR